MTWEQSGTSTAFATKRKFDGAANNVALGLAANAPPDFCGTNSTLCSWMAFDRANRLAQVDSHPDANSSPTINSTRTCFEYDLHGHVKRVAAGCSAASGSVACPIENTGSLQASCAPTSTDYEYDDFGNVVTVTFPWTFNVSAKGVTRYEYDARGNVAKKQTPEMRGAGVYLQYTYDTMGRQLSLTREGGSSVLLYSFTYDNMTVESGCPALANGKGRMTLRNDSFGKTWYSYDAEGRVTLELRRRVGQLNCGGGTTTDKNPSTTYVYDANGDLSVVVYPHGRTIQYVNAFSRPTQIKYNTWDGSVWSATWTAGAWVGTPTTVISGITWEPYGGLRAYQISSSGHWVEYYRGGSLQTVPTQTLCSALPATYAGYDNSERLRGLFVSSSAASVGNPSGSIFKQVYTWNADQLVAQHTCHLNGGAVIADTFGYDKLLRLTSLATNATAPASSEAFTYDLRGNRTAKNLTGPSCGVQERPVTSAAWQGDLLVNKQWGAAYGTTCDAEARFNYWYDNDGRRTSTWDQGGYYQVNTSYSQGALGSGLDSVVGSTTIIGDGQQLGGTFMYTYDALNRRRAKTTPWSSTDEYFYDLGHQLFADRGSDILGSASEFPEDDYVWLGGRPVVIVRGKFSTSWARAADGVNACPRNGWTYQCGTYFPVTDYLGKPVLMLNTSGGTAGSARYQAFGSPNGREARYASPHFVSGSWLAASVSEDMPPGFDGWLQVLFSKVDYSSAVESIGLNGQVQNLGNTPKAHVRGNWEYRSSTGWLLDWNSTTGSGYGFDAESYNFKFKQAFHWWFWTPLGQPGQYYDEETELFENWNRYYDPSIGRYLQPEPLLLKSDFTAAMARKGRSTPTFSYANNNPIANTDPNGLQTCPLGSTCQGCTFVSDDLGWKCPSGIIPVPRPTKTLWDICKAAALAAGQALSKKVKCRLQPFELGSSFCEYLCDNGEKRQTYYGVGGGGNDSCPDELPITETSPWGSWGT